jgi:hypothetical protein
MNLWGFLFLIFSFNYAIASGIEQRCQQLGANCVCSSTLDSSSWISMGGGFWRENDSQLISAGDKRCPRDMGINGYHVYYSMADQPNPEFVAETKMPSGNTITNVARSAAHIGAGLQAQLCQPGSCSSYLGKRVALRYYFKLSSDYQTTHEGLCTNDKYMRIRDYFTSDLRFTSSSGGQFSPALFTSYCKEKWCRLEMVTESYGTGSQTTVYLKQVTDNLPEQSFVIPSARAFDELMVIEQYRGTNGELGISNAYCAGYREVSHAMAAVWTNPIGNERIGAATEVEGGSSGSTPVSTKPSAPKNLRISN